MPTRVEYDQAIQLAQATLRINDPELKGGAVEMIQFPTNIGVAIPKPDAREGGFAIVYRFRTKSGQCRALRCFTQPVHPDWAFRYERMGAYFATHAPDITVPFKYHDPGIRVTLQSNQNEILPVIEMEWVEGMTLRDKLDLLCKHRDRLGIAKLAKQWIHLIGKMRHAVMAHSDIAASNVMVRPNGDLVLIDYDGVYIPDFKHLPPVTAGQPGYQHPQVIQRPFDEWMDDFAHTVIYCALLALSIRPELWDRYTTHDAQGNLLNDNSMFSDNDFLNPAQSPLMRDMLALGSREVTEVVMTIQQFCSMPIAQVRIPRKWLVDEEAEALRNLERAIKHGDEQAILTLWAVVQNYAPAQPHSALVEQVRICKPIREQLAGAIMRDDDILIARLACSQLDAYPYLTHQEKDRIKLAGDRTAALNTFRVALTSRLAERIAASYNPILDTMPAVDPQEREIARLVQQLLNALQAQDEAAIAATHSVLQARRKSAPLVDYTPQQMDTITKAVARCASFERFRSAKPVSEDPVIIHEYETTLYSSRRLTKSDLGRYNAAKKRWTALENLRKALYTKSSGNILATFTKAIETYPHVAHEERQIVELARMLEHVLQQQDDESTVQVDRQITRTQALIYNAAQEQQIKQARARWSAYQDFIVAVKQDDDELIERRYATLPANYPRVTHADTGRVQLARRRLLALKQFRQALLAKNARQIGAAYISDFDTYSPISPTERKVAQVARELVQALASCDDEQIVTVADQIQTLYGAIIYTPDEQQLVTNAYIYWQPLKRLRDAIADDDDLTINNVYDHRLDTYARVSQAEHARVELAHRRVAALQRLRSAFSSGHAEQIVQEYDPVLNGCKHLSDDERRIIALAEQFMHSTHANNDEQIATAAEAIEAFQHQRKPVLVFTPAEQQRIMVAQRYYRALHQFRQAVQSDDDAIITGNYNAAVLDGYGGVTADERRRLALARRRQPAFNRFRTTLQRNQDPATAKAEAIVESYDPILDGYDKVDQDERRRLQEARDFLALIRALQAALPSDDDEAIMHVYRGHELLLEQFSGLGATEKRRILLAQARSAAIERFRVALQSKSIEAMLSAYDSTLLDTYHKVRPDERETLTLAQYFMDALQSDDDDAIARTGHKIRQTASLVLSSGEQARVDLANEQLAIVQRFRIAIAHNDDALIVTLAQQHPFLPVYPKLTLDERNRLTLAQQRPNALTRLRAAATSRSAVRVVNAFDAGILDGYALFEQTERTLVANARTWQQRLKQMRQAIDALKHLPQAGRQAHYRTIMKHYDAHLNTQFPADLSNEEKQWIAEATSACKLEELVNAGRYEDTLRFALEHSRSAGLDAGLIRRARKAFLLNRDPRNLTAYLEGNRLVAEWDWPQTDLITVACLVWREDHAPIAPNEPGNTSLRVSRRIAELRGKCIHTLSSSPTRLYVNIYATIPGEYDSSQRQPHWDYSAGSDPSTKQIASRRTRATVVYRIVAASPNGERVLEVQTQDGTPLPELVLVKKAGGYPLTVTDGELVQQVPKPDINRLCLPFNVSNWKPKSYIRVFPADPNDQNWVNVIGDPDPRIIVT